MARASVPLADLLAHVLEKVRDENASAHDVAEAVFELEALVGGPPGSCPSPRTCALYMEVLGHAAIRLADHVAREDNDADR